MGTPFPRYYRDETSITLTNTTATNSTTTWRVRSYHYDLYKPKKETAFEKKRRLETKQQKRDRLSLENQIRNRYQFNEPKPRIKQIVTNPKMMMR